MENTSNDGTAFSPEMKAILDKHEKEYDELISLVKSLSVWLTYWERQIELLEGNDKLEILRMRAGRLLIDIQKSQSTEDDLLDQLKPYLLDHQSLS